LDLAPVGGGKTRHWARTGAACEHEAGRGMKRVPMTFERQ